jgi:hypothetical protein
LKEREQLTRELARLAEAVAAGGQLPVLLGAMQTKQRRVSEIGASLEHLDGLDPDIRGKLRQYQTALINLCLQSTRGLAEVLQDKQSARQILSSLFPSPIVVTPEVGPNGKALGWTIVERRSWERSLAICQPPRARQERYTNAQSPWAARG